MARRRLDRSRPAGDVYGVHELGARFYQDGHYFDAKGKYVCSEVGVKPPADDGSPEPEEDGNGPAPPPASVQVRADGGELTPRDKLMQLNIGQLTKMIKAAGGEPITGAGAKARAIDWLLEHVPAA